MDLFGHLVQQPEYALVFSTWLWRRFEATPRCYLLALHDELFALMSETLEYTELRKHQLLPNLLHAYEILDEYLSLHFALNYVVHASYRVLSDSIVVLQFTIPQGNKL